MRTALLIAVTLIACALATHAADFDPRNIDPSTFTCATLRELLKQYTEQQIEDYARNVLHIDETTIQRFKACPR